MFRYFLIIIFFLNYGFCALSQTSESKVKVGLIYRFSQFIEWKDEPTIDTFRFGLFSNDSILISEFKSISLSKKMKAKPIKIFVDDEIINFNKMQCIFIDYNFRKHLSKIAKTTQNKGVLLISYNTTDLLLTMINIYKVKKESILKFEVNKNNLDKNGFTYKPDLLLYGGSLVDIQELYISTNNRLETKSEEIDSINKDLNKLMIKSAEYRNEMEQMSAHIKIMQQQNDKKEKEAKQLNYKISKNDSSLRNLNAELYLQKIYKESLSIKLKNKIDSILQGEANLKSLNDELKEKKEHIFRNQIMIDDQNLKIEAQKKELLIAVFLGITLVITVLSVIIALRVKRQLANRLKYLVDKKTADLNKSQQYYFSLFENSPVAICEFDLSELFDYLKLNKIKSLNNEYIMGDDLVFEAAKKIRVTDTNFQVLDLYDAISKKEFIDKYQQLFNQKSLKGLKVLFAKLLNNEKQFDFEITRISLKNEVKHIIQSFTVLPEDKGEYSKVLVSMLDITDLKMYEREILRHRDHLEDLVKERAKEIILLNENLFNTNEELHSKNEDLSEKNSQLSRQKQKITELNKGLTDTNKQLEEQKEELLNTLSQLNDTQMQLVESEKMASLGMLTAGVAHEINNPINFISSGSQALDMIFKDMWDKIDDFRFINEENSTNELVEKVKTFLKEAENENYKAVINEIIENIQLGVDRITEIVNSLQTYSRKSDIDSEAFNIHDGIDNALVILRNKYKYKVEIVKEYGDLPLIISSSGKLNQVFVNLFSNAFDAINTKGVVKVISSYNKKDEGIEIIIIDNGVGIDEKSLGKVFDPFYTTKEVGQGTGLGMYITYGIINQLKGTIKVESKVGKGTQVILNLPVKSYKIKV